MYNINLQYKYIKLSIYGKINKINMIGFFGDIELKIQAIRKSKTPNLVSKMKKSVR